MTLDLCFVRWYEVIEPEAGEEIVGLQKLRWEKEAGRRRNQVVGRFDIISVASIERPVFLQPHPCSPDVWFYNHFV